MGKRKKSSRGPVKKVKQKLDTQFSCLFCNHEKAISCTMDKKSQIGTLHCKICGQSFQSPINSLSQPVDVYSDWVDACEAVAAEQSELDKNFVVREGDGSDEEEDLKDEEDFD